MRKLNCPDCGAMLVLDDANREFAFCQYCGCKVMLSDKVTTKHIIDEAKIEKVKSNERVKMAKMEMDSVKRHKVLPKVLYLLSFLSIVGIGWIVRLLVINEMWESEYVLFIMVSIIVPYALGGFGYSLEEKEKNEYKQLIRKKQSKDLGVQFSKIPNKICINRDTLTYDATDRILRNAGFMNIETINLCDIKGLTKKLDVKKIDTIDDVTIDGESYFQLEDKDEFYESDTPIIIYYHGTKN